LLVGQTKSKDKFNGPIGERLYMVWTDKEKYIISMVQVNELERKSSFTVIPSLATLPAIPEEVVKHMSNINNANLLYQLGLVITTSKS
jgi:hypothetical protein